MLPLSPWLLLLPVVAAPCIWLLWFAGRRRFEHVTAVERKPEERAEGTLETVCFPACDGTVLEAWLCLPRLPRPGIIVMAPGLCGTKEGPVEWFAWRFVAAGWGVLMLDYRSFGGSGGFPRHHVDPLRQIEDTRSAVDYVRTALGERVDVERVVLWGSSFSAAAAICTAADLGPQIAAVVGQVPYVGGEPVHAPSALQMTRYVVLVMAEIVGDALAKLVGISRPPVYIDAYGRPGERAFAMSRDNPSRKSYEVSEAHVFFQRLPDPLRGGWENRMAVRGLQNLDDRDPLEDVARVECPILLVGARLDDMIPIERIREAAQRASHPESHLVELDCSHFDPYLGDDFERSVSAQLEFLRAISGA